jgi:hypothetical protein
MATVPINDIKPFNSYVASANQTEFVYDWYVFKAQYIHVYKNDILLTYQNDYSVPTVGIMNPTGGKIILTAPCTAGDKIVISRKSIAERLSGYTESGEFRSTAVNNDINYLISLIQEINFLLERCVTIPPSDADTVSGNLVMPSFQSRIGKYLAFDNSGTLTAIEGTSIDLYYNWTRITSTSTLDKLSKKVYTQITSQITLALPMVAEADDGREMFVLNLDSNAHNTIIQPHSSSITIDGLTQVSLSPGEYKKFVYNHALLKWFSID